MKICIEGAGEVGSHLAKLLRSENNDVTVLDCDEGRLSAIAGAADVDTALGHPSSITSLRDAGVSKADLFISVMPQFSQEINIVSALLAKKLGATQVFARVNDEDYFARENERIFKDMGLDLMFYPEKIAAEDIVTKLGNDSIESIGLFDGHLLSEAFLIGEESEACNMNLIELTESLTPEEKDAFRVIAVSRKGKVLLPGRDTEFNEQDVVYVISRKESAGIPRKLFGRYQDPVSSVMIMGGASALALMVARLLVKRGVSVKIVEKDYELCRRLNEELSDDVIVVHNDYCNPDVLLNEGIRGFDAFIALTGQDETNILSCVMAGKYDLHHLVAEVENLDYKNLALDSGVDIIINKKETAAQYIFKHILGGKARFARYLIGSEANLIEYTAEPGSPVTSAPIRDLGFPKKAIICGIRRGNDAFIAVGDTCVEANDNVAVLVLTEYIRDVERFFRA